jgi:hypothetical protein
MESLSEAVEHSARVSETLLEALQTAQEMEEFVSQTLHRVLQSEASGHAVQLQEELRTGIQGVIDQASALTGCLAALQN